MDARKRGRNKIEIRDKHDLVEIEASGTLSGDDYDRLVPELGRLAATRGPLALHRAA